MKLLSYEDYTTSIHQTQGGLSQEVEDQLYFDCLRYVTSLCENQRVHPDIMGTAMSMMHYYLKKVPFTQIDRNLVATVCVYLACKIDYRHLSMESVAKFYFVQNNNNKKVKLPIEEVFKIIYVEFTQTEIVLLEVIEFDLEFDLPTTYLKCFKS